MGRIGRDRLARWKSAAKWVGAVVVGLGFIAAMGWGAWWLIDVPSPDSAVPGAGSGNVEVVRTVLTAMVGAGGLVTLVVVIRRQWSQEQAHKLAVRIADDTQHDAEERRITELYMTAAEQLGHEKASVRLAALYALDRLGRNHPGHRQEVVDIWCAYLRQPFIPPARFTHTEEEAAAEPPRPVDSTVDAYLTPPEQATDADPAKRRQEEEAREQEYEVRATAQRLLTRHLTDPRPKDEHTEEPPPASADGYWQMDRIDLTGATLIDIDFFDCHLPQAVFTRVHFHGDAWFRGARFHGGVSFDNARFHEVTRFGNAHFHKHARFGGAHFHGGVSFDNARFHEYVWFEDARFHGEASFSSAHFHGGTMFSNARFQKEARFDKAHFHEMTLFSSAHFHEMTLFSSAHFHEIALFGHIVVREHTVLHFKGARAVWESLEWEGWVHTWPSGWRLVPFVEGEGEPGWGRLVRGVNDSTTEATPPISV